MSQLPRRLPVSEEERMKILLTKAGSSVAGITRFEGDVHVNPTVTPNPSNRVYVQENEPEGAEVGDLWVKD